jgi:hypothetical protein
MEPLHINEYYSLDKCLQLLKDEGFEIVTTEYQYNATRITIKLTYFNKSNEFYLSNNDNDYVFLGLSASNEEARMKLSRICHQIKDELKDSPMMMMKALIREDWFLFGSSVIWNLEKYPYLINENNYENIKNDIRDAFETIDYEKQNAGSLSICVGGIEKKQLFRALLELGYIYSVKKDLLRTVVLNDQYKNSELFVQKLSKLGYNVR